MKTIYSVNSALHVCVPSREDRDHAYRARASTSKPNVCTIACCHLAKFEGHLPYQTAGRNTLGAQFVGGFDIHRGDRDLGRTELGWCYHGSTVVSSTLVLLHVGTSGKFEGYFPYQMAGTRRNTLVVTIHWKDRDHTEPSYYLQIYTLAQST